MDTCVAALGFFDGVHLGHGGLLKRARAEADRLGCPAVAVTFDRSPASVITGHRETLISTGEDREYLMKSLYGIDSVVFLHFGRTLMQMPWQEFLQACLLQEFHACHVVCGEDYTFGYRGEGNTACLRRFCEEKGLGCDVIPEIMADGRPVHSTLIRGLLEQGRLEEAARFMGHPYLLSGTIVSGKRLGRTLGTPTANIPFPSELLKLPRGVYASKVETDTGEYVAVTNIGICPTVWDSDAVTVESWLQDFSGDLYGKQVRLRLYSWLRPERKFGSLEELQATILLDAQHTREYFL